MPIMGKNIYFLFNWESYLLTRLENCYVLGQIAFVEFYTSVKDGSLFHNVC